MEKMQAFIDFSFHEVWCKAPEKGQYRLELFENAPELHEVMTSFHYDDSKGAEFFSGHVEHIYGLFSAQTSAQINQFRQWYQGNNDLEKLSANDPAVHLARYADIAVTYTGVSGQLAAFFKGLYSQSLLGRNDVELFADLFAQGAHRIAAGAPLFAGGQVMHHVDPGQFRG